MAWRKGRRRGEELRGCERKDLGEGPLQSRNGGHTIRPCVPRSGSSAGSGSLLVGRAGRYCCPALPPAGSPLPLREPRAPGPLHHPGPRRARVSLRPIGERQHTPNAVPPRVFAGVRRGATTRANEFAATTSRCPPPRTPRPDSRQSGEAPSRLAVARRTGLLEPVADGLILRESHGTHPCRTCRRRPTSRVHCRDFNRRVSGSAIPPSSCPRPNPHDGLSPPVPALARAGPVGEGRHRGFIAAISIAGFRAPPSRPLLCPRPNPHDGSSPPVPALARAGPVGEGRHRGFIAAISIAGFRAPPSCPLLCPRPNPHDGPPPGPGTRPYRIRRRRPTSRFRCRDFNRRGRASAPKRRAEFQGPGLGSKAQSRITRISGFAIPTGPFTLACTPSRHGPDSAQSVRVHHGRADPSAAPGLWACEGTGGASLGKSGAVKLPEAFSSRQ